jgi:hypothetical protein
MAKRHGNARLTQSVGRRHRTGPELIPDEAEMLLYERGAQREAEPNQGGDGPETAKQWRGG